MPGNNHARQQQTSSQKGDVLIRLPCSSRINLVERLRIDDALVRILCPSAAFLASSLACSPGLFGGRLLCIKVDRLTVASGFESDAHSFGSFTFNTVYKLDLDRHQAPWLM